MIFTHHYFNKSYRFIPLCLPYLSLSSPGSFLPHRHFPTPHQICRACQGVEVQPPTGIHLPGEGKVGSLPTIILQRFPTSQTVVGIWDISGCHQQYHLRFFVQKFCWLHSKMSPCQLPPGPHEVVPGRGL